MIWVLASRAEGQCIPTASSCWFVLLYYGPLRSDHVEPKAGTQWGPCPTSMGRAGQWGLSWMAPESSKGLARCGTGTKLRCSEDSLLCFFRFLPVSLDNESLLTPTAGAQGQECDLSSHCTRTRQSNMGPLWFWSRVAAPVLPSSPATQPWPLIPLPVLSTGPLS